MRETRCNFQGVARQTSCSQIYEQGWENSRGKWERRWKMKRGKCCLLLHPHPSKVQKQTESKDNPRIILIDGSRDFTFPSFPPSIIDRRTFLHLIYILEMTLGDLNSRIRNAKLISRKHLAFARMEFPYQSQVFGLFTIDRLICMHELAAI